MHATVTHLMMKHDDDDDDDIFMVNGDGDPIENGTGGASKGKKRRRKPVKEALNPLQRYRVVSVSSSTRRIRSKAPAPGSREPPAISLGDNVGSA